ncbi:MAG: 23S rRNA (uridine2552-2'-O)-methyltransferase [Paracoccaceae bacterium]|jgi:23S rRNA (uridine2552-2'-O)-methyltransferase
MSAGADGKSGGGKSGGGSGSGAGAGSGTGTGTGSGTGSGTGTGTGAVSGTGAGGKSPTPRNTSGRGRRDLTVRVKTAKGRKTSSTRWLERQLNDPYVMRAKADGYRGRAAYKLLEIDDKFALLKPGMRVVDLGCAPGGWLQVAVQRVNAMGEGRGKRGMVLGADLQEMEALAGARTIQLDFLDEEADAAVKRALGGTADIVLSDMAASASGHRATDHMRIVLLCEAAALFARDVLTPGGSFVAKVLNGGAEADLLAILKKDFNKVHHMKPPASRKDSAEMYLVATGFRGVPGDGDATEPEDDPDAGPLG